MRNGIHAASAPFIRYGALLLILAVGAGPADALTFRAKLDAASVVPSGSSTATGDATLVLGDAGQLSISMNYAGLGSASTTVHIHGPAAAGANGPVVLSVPSTSGTSGTIANQVVVLSPAQVTAMRDRQYYVDVHSAALPGGEIRGQIDPDVSLTGTLSGAQENPPSGTTGTGRVRVVFNESTRVINATIAWQGLTGAVVASHFHGPAPVGANAAVVVPVTLASTAGGFATFTSSPITPAQATQLLDGQWYFNIHTGTFPGGEIRAQLERLFDDTFD